MSKKDQNTKDVLDGKALAKRSEEDVTNVLQPITADFLEGVLLERVITLPDGFGFEGKFLGEGPALEVNDPVTGERRPVKTWRFDIQANIKCVARILGGARLDADLPLVPVGAMMKIAKIGQNATSKNRRVNDYIVARCDGKQLGAPLES